MDKGIVCDTYTRSRFISFVQTYFTGSPRRSQARPTVNWTTTLGLVVHAAADGIAMGAAAATHQVYFLLDNTVYKIVV
jgi:hypothetical protein